MVGFLAVIGLLARILFTKPPDLPTEWRDSPFSDFGVKEVGASEDNEMQSALRYSYRDTSSHRAGTAGLISRPARMAERRTTGTGSGSAAYQRMAAREEEARAAMNDRIEKALDRIIDEIGEVKTEVRRIDQKSGGLENRMTDIERQMIDTRDAVQRARAAVPAATVSAGRQVADELKKSWLAKVAAVCISIMAVYTLTQAIPKMVRATDHFLAWVRMADAPQNGKATDKTTST